MWNVALVFQQCLRLHRTAYKDYRGVRDGQIMEECCVSSGFRLVLDLRWVLESKLLLGCRLVLDLRVVWDLMMMSGFRPVNGFRHLSGFMMVLRFRPMLSSDQCCSSG